MKKIESRCNTFCCNVVSWLYYYHFHCLANLIKWLFECECPPGGGSGSGSGSWSGSPNYKGIKVPDKKDVIGTGFHRSGWNRVYSALQNVHSPEGIFLDDFIEQNFSYSSTPEVYDEPWAGIFHHPPTHPYFANFNERFDRIINLPEFKKSAKHLKLAIALSSPVARALRTDLPNTEVLFVKHPTFFEFKKWSPEAYERNFNKKLVQVGFYLRNLQLANQIPCVADLDHMIVRIMNNQDWVWEFDKKVRHYWDNVAQTRNFYDQSVDIKHMIPPSKFDKLLSENIVIVEYFSLSASNTLLDCINRNTPIFVNKTEAVVDYLGEDYPGYFTHPAQIPALIHRVYDCHEYLKNMDKSDLTIDHFITTITNAINE